MAPGMYILYAPDFPERPLPRAAVENAWTGAGLPQPVPVFAGPEVAPVEVQALVYGTLDAAGATRAADRDGDLEVPDEAAPLLERLEEFYHRVYPETRTSPARGHFHYESLEWLGEF